MYIHASDSGPVVIVLENDVELEVMTASLNVTTRTLLSRQNDCGVPIADISEVEMYNYWKSVYDVREKKRKA